MKIEELDKNLRVESHLGVSDVVWQEASASPCRLYGALPDVSGGYLRLPEDIARQVNPGVAGLCRNTAGIRLRFATDSPYVALKVEWGGFCRMSHMPVTGSGGFDLYAVQNGRQQYVATAIPPMDAERGFESLMWLSPNGMTDYVLNFPLYNNVDRVYIGVAAGHRLAAGREEYRRVAPVVFYGSSITQGGCASRPGNHYEARLSRMLNMDFVNLGFSGSAHGEPVMAEYMAGLDMSAFVCDYDHNAANVEELKSTHYRLYETIRRAHPELPIVFVSRPSRSDCLDDRQRLAVIADSFARGVAAGDAHLYWISGNAFFPGDTGDDCTVDGCHPTDLGFYFMAQTLAPTLEKLLRAAEEK